jgi:Down syndrome cell adhesion molecule-like protein 1
MLSLNVGDRASITCSVQKGDTPLHIKWLKNGILIDPSQRISVTQVDQFNSILVIEHLQASHSGNYSCVVSNQAAEVESSQALLVNGKKISMKSNFVIVFLRVLQGELSTKKK